MSWFSHAWKMNSYWLNPALNAIPGWGTAVDIAGNALWSNTGNANVNMNSSGVSGSMNTSWTPILLIGGAYLVYTMMNKHKR